MCGSVKPVNPVSSEDTRGWAYVESEFQRAYDGIAIASGQDHPNTLRALHRLAVCTRSYRREDHIHRNNGMARLKECYEKSRVKLGPDHIDSLSVLYDIGEFEDMKTNYNEAAVCFSECYRRRRRLLGKEHPTVLDAQNKFMQFQAMFFPLLFVFLLGTCACCSLLFFNISIIRDFSNGTALLTGESLTVVTALSWFPYSLMTSPAFIPDQANYLLRGTAGCSVWWKVLYFLSFLACNCNIIVSIWAMVLIVNRDSDKGNLRYLYVLYYYFIMVGGMILGFPTKAILECCERRNKVNYIERQERVEGAYKDFENLTSTELVSPFHQVLA